MFDQNAIFGATLACFRFAFEKIGISGGNTVAYESDIQLRLTSHIAKIEYKTFEVCAFESCYSCAMILQF